MATIANIVDDKLSVNSAEDSNDLSPLFFGENIGIDAGEKAIREAIVNHSVDGSLAIRQGNWKMTHQPGTGGWAFVQNGKIKGKYSRATLQFKNRPNRIKQPLGQTSRCCKRTATIIGKI